MKKRGYILLVIFIAFVGSLFSQTKISQEQLLGSWEVISIEGKKGSKDEKDVIGSIFYFKESGILVAGMPPEKAERTKSAPKKGFWKIVDDTLTIYREDEDPEKDKGTVLLITNYEGDKLTIFDNKEEVTVIFKRVK